MEVRGSAISRYRATLNDEERQGSFLVKHKLTGDLLQATMRIRKTVPLRDTSPSKEISSFAFPTGSASRLRRP